MSLIIWKGVSNALVLANNSPIFEYGDRVKVTDIYHGPQSLCAAGMLARGTYGTGFRAGWVVNQSTCKTMRGTIGELAIEWEAGGTGADQPLPSGEVRLEPQELYPTATANPYFYSDGVLVLLPVDYGYAQATRHASTPMARQNALDNLTARAASSDTTIATSGTLGLALADMYAKGIDTYYQTGYRFIWEFYTYTLPAVSHGGYIQNPTEVGAPAGSTVESISWLRLADAYQPAGVNGSMWKMTYTWLGGQSGYWDSRLYPSE